MGFPVQKGSAKEPRERSRPPPPREMRVLLGSALSNTGAGAARVVEALSARVRMVEKYMTAIGDCLIGGG